MESGHAGGCVARIFRISNVYENVATFVHVTPLKRAGLEGLNKDSLVPCWVLRSVGLARFGSAGASFFRFTLVPIQECGNPHYMVSVNFCEPSCELL